MDTWIVLCNLRFPTFVPLGSHMSDTSALSTAVASFDLRQCVIDGHAVDNQAYIVHHC